MATWSRLSCEHLSSTAASSSQRRPPSPQPGARPQGREQSQAFWLGQEQKAGLLPPNPTSKCWPCLSKNQSCHRAGRVLQDGQQSPRSTGLFVISARRRGGSPRGWAEKQVGSDQGPSTLGLSPNTRRTASASVRLSVYVSGPLWRKEAEVGLRVNGKGP